MPNEIIAVLQARVAPLTIAAYIRQEASGLTPTLVNVSDISSMDAYIDTRVSARADGVKLNIDSYAGRYSWPFDDVEMQAIFPMADQATRDETARLHLTTAADAVSMYVLGDLYSRAAKKDQHFEESAIFYIGEYKDPTYNRLPIVERGQAGMTEWRVINSIRNALKGVDRDDASMAIETVAMYEDKPCGEKDKPRREVTTLRYNSGRGRGCC